MAKKKIEVQGLEITINKDDYISLTDLAKKSDSEARFIIRSWLKNSNTLEFLETWEILHNQNFKRDQMVTFRLDSQSNSKVVTPQKLIEKTNAIGIVSKSGRYGGTYAHSDIALNFAYWLSPSFQVYFIKEFQRLKKETSELEWTVRRELTKINYDIHTQAVKDNIIPRLKASKSQGIAYASEADILNVALFGMTAKEWKQINPKLKGNIRDHASTAQLTILSNLESLNAVFIADGLSQNDRLEKLNQVAIYQMQILMSSNKIKRLE